MKSILSALLLLGLCVPAFAQDSEQKVQIHGFATQGFIYSSDNNYLTTKSSEGSAEWSEAALSVNASLNDKLRGGMQLHYVKLGAFGGQNVVIDWASADYHANQYFGVRVGKVKTPVGLFNDSQDVDTAHLWALLPQSIYKIDSKGFSLSHYGAEVYGSVPVAKFGKVEYRGYGGQRNMDANDGYVRGFRETGFDVEDGLSGAVYGADIRWKAPIRGFVAGASLQSIALSGSATTTIPGLGPVPADLNLKRLNVPQFYVQYERGKFYAAGEYRRTPGTFEVALPIVTTDSKFDYRAWYLMTSYKASEKLTVGTYYSNIEDYQNKTAAPGRHSKDWTISSRYDFNQYFYAKAEGHFVRGTGLGYYASTNPHGLKDNASIAVLKAGFSF